MGAGCLGRVLGTKNLVEVSMKQLNKTGFGNLKEREKPGLPSCRKGLEASLPHYETAERATAFLGLVVRESRPGRCCLFIQSGGDYAGSAGRNLYNLSTETC